MEKDLEDKVEEVEEAVVEVIKAPFKITEKLDKESLFVLQKKQQFMVQPKRTQRIGI